MSQLLGQCVGLLSRKSWQSLRSQVEGPFTHVAIANDAALIRAQTRKFVEQLSNTGDFRNGIFDPAKDINFYPFFVVATLLYGDLDAEDVQWLRKIAPLRQKLFTYVISGGLARFSVSRFLPTTANRLLHEFQQEWSCFNESIYEKAKARGDTTPMTKLWEDSKEGRIDQVQVRVKVIDSYGRISDSWILYQLLQTLDESLFANLDVTTGAISWNFIYLASSPNDQARLVEEIKRECGPDDIHWDAYIARSDTFLASCINESSRLRPVARMFISSKNV